MNTFEIEKTFIEGLLVIKSKIFEDERGFFQEIYNEKFFKKLGIREKFLQDNYSCSKKGVLRGLHFQIDNPQAKLVRVINGSIYDVAVDLRLDSKTYGKYFSIILTREDNLMLYVPKGFAHGFLSLENHTEILYKCSDFYNPKDESGIIWSDKTINIDWKLKEFGIEEKRLILSEKDKNFRVFNKK